MNNNENEAAAIYRKRMRAMRRIGLHKSPDGYIDVTVPPVMAEEFKQAMRRATNTWPDMSEEMRDFLDRLLDRDKAMGKNMKANIYRPEEDSTLSIEIPQFLPKK